MQTRPLSLYHHGKIGWDQPPQNPHLKRNELHLWLVNLTIFEKTDDFLKILSPDEKARFSRLASPQKRAAFMGGRAALRLVLARYLKFLPGEIGFGYQKKGKPYLTDPFRGSEIQFNLSHSGHWMVLGVCRVANLGIDIEKVRPVKKNWALEKIFSAEDRDNLTSLPEGEIDNAFIAAWTKKEAAAKAAGTGLAGYSAIKRTASSQSGIILNEDYFLPPEDPFWYISFEPLPGYLSTAAMQTIEKPFIKFYEFSLV